MSDSSDRERQAHADRSQQTPQVPRVDFEDLAGDSSYVIVVCNDREYRLIRTRNGGLILNK